MSLCEIYLAYFKGVPMKMIVFLSVFFAMNAYASVKNVKCVFDDTTFMSQFELEVRDIDFSSESFVNVEFDFTLKPRGRDPKIERYVVTRNGALQTFAAGTFYKHETARMFSVVKGDELEYINILVDVPPLYTSQIRFLNGMTYFGSCKSY